MTELTCLILVLPFAVAIVLAAWRMDKERNDRKKRFASEEWESDQS